MMLRLPTITLLHLTDPGRTSVDLDLKFSLTRGTEYEPHVTARGSPPRSLQMRRFSVALVGVPMPSAFTGAPDEPRVRISRTLLLNCLGVNGFSMKSISGSGTPWCAIRSAV